MPDLLFLIKAVKSWCITAIPLLVIGAFVVSMFSVGSEKIAYISSAISFAAATAAGRSAARSNQGGTLFTGLISGCLLVIILLTLGFLIDSQAVTAAGIISVVSFTFAGCLFGAVILSDFGRKKNKRSFSFSK